MQNKPKSMTVSTDAKNIAKCIITDLLLFLFIYLVPFLSHLTGIPFYLLEPLRVSVMLSYIVTRSKGNAYIVALTLPLFSFATASHPVFLKCLIMMTELVLNIFILDKLASKMKGIFLPAFISIVASKCIYYLLKYLLVKSSLLSMSLVSTPLWIQAVMTLVLAAVFALSIRRKPVS